MSINLSIVLLQADELSKELRDFLGDPQQAAFADMKPRINLELVGYDFKKTVPRYRYVASQHRGLLIDGEVVREIDLPTRHISFGQNAIVREGRLSLSDMVGFKEAIEIGQGRVNRPISLEALYGYAWGLTPGSGTKILRAWEIISATSLMQMLNTIRIFLEHSHLRVLNL